MQANDLFAARPIGPAQHFLVVCQWKQTGGAWTADRIRAVESSFVSLVTNGLQVGGAPKLAESWNAVIAGVQLDVECRLFDWDLEPLTVRVGVTAVARLAPWARRTGAEEHGSELRPTPLLELVEKIGSGAGEAVARALQGLEFVQATATMVSDGQGTPASGRLHPGDIEAVRSELIPVEYGLLFDALAAASQHMMTLSDLLAVAESKALDDNDVLGFVNFYGEKGLLHFDRAHQVVKLTEHGLAVCRNSLS